MPKATRRTTPRPSPRTVRSSNNLEIDKDGPDDGRTRARIRHTILTSQERSAGQRRATVRRPRPAARRPDPARRRRGAGNNWACQVVARTRSTSSTASATSRSGDEARGDDPSIQVFITAESGRSLDNEACVDPDDKIEETRPARTTTARPQQLPSGPRPSGRPTSRSPRRPTSSVSPGGDLDLHITSRTRATPTPRAPLTVTDDLADHLDPRLGIGTNGWTCQRPRRP